MKQLVDMLLTFVRQIAILLLGLFSMPLTTRLLEPEEFGALGLLFTATGLATTLGVGGVSSAIIYFRNKNQLAPKPVDLVLWKLIAMGAVVALICLAASYSFLARSPVLKAMEGLIIAYLLGTTALAVLKAPAEGIILSEKRFGFTAIVGVSMKALTVIGLALLYVSGMTGLSFVLELMLALAALQVALYWFCVGRSIRASPQTNEVREAVKLGELCSYSWKTTTADFVAKLNYRADTILLAVLSSPFELGLYSIGVGIAEKLWIVSRSIGEVSFSYLAQSVNKHEALVNEALITAKWTAVLTLFLCIGVASITPVLGNVFGARYLDAARPLLFLLPGIFALGVSRVISNAITAMGQPMINTKFGMYGLVLNLAANIVLIPSMGAAGAALATSLSYSFMFLLRLFYLKRHGHSLTPLFTISTQEIELGVRLAKTRFSLASPTIKR